MNRQSDLVLCALICTGITWLASVALAFNADGLDRNQDQGVTASAGRTVWDGVYTEKQATRGREPYIQECAGCHAEDLRGDGTSPSLIEEDFAFLWEKTTVGELLMRIRTVMPPQAPNSLPAASYCDIVAFILQANKFPAGDKELEADLEALGKILIIAKRPTP